MDLRMLGPLEVRLEDGPIELGPRKQRAVLAMLALEAGKTVSADRLVEGLWGERPPATAPKMVQLYVSHLRRALGENGARIVTRGRGYELQVPGEAIDTLRFARMLETQPRDALALWRGEPLADLADEPFAAAEIRRLEELRLHAVELAISAELAAGRHASLISELDALVVEHPLRERLHAQRMLALYRSGRQAEALEAYRAAREALVEQIGVEPGAELRRLHERVLAQDPALDLPTAEAPRRAAEPPPAGAPHAEDAAVRRARPLLLGAAAVLLAGVLAFGVIRAVEPDGLDGIDEDAVGVVDADGGRIAAQYSVGRGASAAAAGGGSVWVANRRDGTVSRIDREREQVVTIAVGGAPAALAYGGGSLWVADGASRTVAQVDPGANKVLQRIEVGNAPAGVAFAGGALWVASGVDGLVYRVDLDRARVTRTVRVGARPTALAAGAGALWVSSEESGTVTRIDPRSASVVGSIGVGNGPGPLAADKDALYVVNRRDGTLSRVDPRRDAVAWTVRVGGDPAAVSAGAGAVWVADGERGALVRVDTDEPRVLRRLGTGGGPAALAVAGGSVWAVGSAPAAAHRGGTLRVLVPTDPPMPSNWLNEGGYLWPTWQTTSLAYDGLVAYRRVGGVAGATLVGALATAAPAPSRDGRSYTFTLRPGLRYSDGRPVRPADFRSSMERFFTVTRSSFPPFYAGIVGARRCMNDRLPCDLSRGIETDATARTITVNLAEPDAEFLHKLTLPFAYVVPPDAPRSTSPGVIPAGTGPYRIATWDPRRGGTLVRNPRFRSSGDRPTGFADRVDVRITSLKQPERGIAAVQRGDADLVSAADAFRSNISRERLAAVVARAPGRVHSDAAAGLEYMFLNVNRRPFDDLRVRRAVNLAADRARLVELAGGPEVATAACQFVPAAFPGHEPYCPHTAHPAAGRGWTAPDLDRARKLVAESGRAGDPVEVLVPAPRRATGHYFAELLDDIGLDAHLRVQPEQTYFGRIYDPRSRAQMGFVGWAADYISASTFIEPNFGCTDGVPNDENPSRLCDPPLAREVARARALSSAEALPAWAAADRRVSDLAPAVPMTNARTVVLVSERAGNVQDHPQWFTLLDQVWVR